MTPDRESKLTLYSLGIVIEDKEDGSDQIKVYPVEEMPFIDGSIKDFKKEHKVSSQNAKGVPKAASSKGDAEIVATWIPGSSGNRMTPPDVVANETVKIYRYADTDEYYWETLFREPSLRRLEKVCYMYGNLPSGQKAFDKTSSYWIEVNTKDQIVQLQTTKTNQEPFAYNVAIDTGDGTVVIKDDGGNSFTLNSKTASFNITNAEGSSIDMTGGNLTVTVPDTITFNANKFVVNALTLLMQGMTVSGNNGQGATSTMNGSMNVTGNVSSNQSIHADNEVTATGSMTAPVFNGHLNGSDND